MRAPLLSRSDLRYTATLSAVRTRTPTRISTTNACEVSTEMVRASTSCLRTFSLTCARARGDVGAVQAVGH